MIRLHERYPPLRSTDDVSDYKTTFDVFLFDEKMEQSKFTFDLTGYTGSIPHPEGGTRPFKDQPMTEIHKAVADINLEWAKLWRPTCTPWGGIQQLYYHAPGIFEVGTAGHGGFILSAERQAEMPEALRMETNCYEEDCDWSCVVVAFADKFPATMSKDFKLAFDTLRNWKPSMFEAHFKCVLKPGESFIRDEENFYAENKDKYIVTSASALGDNLVECSAAIGGYRRGPRPPEEKTFLVPSAEYETRGRHGFVIDPARHQAIPEGVELVKS